MDRVIKIVSEHREWKEQRLSEKWIRWETMWTVKCEVLFLFLFYVVFCNVLLRHSLASYVALPYAILCFTVVCWLVALCYLCAVLNYGAKICYVVIVFMLCIVPSPDEL